ncbi:MAG: flavodoxin domain-containing protein [Candidatus Falkowbacteria bacterium]|nr:MAG: flavodoxin domain-containing protein [Candidatus Falkowbacteria bacterium]
MKVLIIFDSMYGNTEIIARDIAKAFPQENMRLLNVKEVKVADLLDVQLLIVGSPTYGGRPKQETQTFLEMIPDAALTGKKVAAFDTRFLAAEQSFGLRLLMKTIGYAAPRILKILVAKGGEAISAPEGFIVQGKQGALKDGERERAALWGKNLSLS